MRFTYLHKLYINKDNHEFKKSSTYGKCCQVCQYIEETGGFEDTDGNKYQNQKKKLRITKQILQSLLFTNFIVNSCSKQYVGDNIIDFYY